MLFFIEAAAYPTKQIQQNIKEINAKLTQGEKEIILAEASKEDPVGYLCEKQILNLTEVSFVEQVHCYDTTEEVCSLVICFNHYIIR